MAGDVAIRTEKLGKRYRLGERAAYGTLREALRRAAAAPVRRLRGPRREAAHVWALKDLDFEVRQGEAVGIIGRNGAGKSTLLKLLTRITRPTTGAFEIRGRVGSLLEVGAGFHPELTGRENVYLNGAILGMSRREIERKFESIVDFSGVEEFLDTPVKRYSSGMRVRLAFAVAAHLEPDVLIVDEVLAVGDNEFQKKCLGKMDEVTRGGRTVLFVSHNMPAVSRLCEKGLVLAHGEAAYWGGIESAVQHYLTSGAAGSRGRADLRRAERWPGAEPLLTWVATLTADGSATTAFQTGESLVVRFGYHLPRALKAYAQVNVTDLSGERLLTLRSSYTGEALELAAGDGWIECRADDLRLLGGEYILSIELGTEEGIAHWLDFVQDAVRIEAHLGDYLGGAQPAKAQAKLAQRSQWTCGGGAEGGGDGA